MAGRRHEDRTRAIDLLAGDLRTIYVPTLRGHRHQLYELFDYPDDEAVNSARNTSSVRTQSLYLMNNPLVMEYSLALVKRLSNESILSDSGKLERLYQLCFGRQPTDAEIADDLQFVQSQLVASDERQAWRRLAQLSESEIATLKGQSSPKRRGPKNSASVSRRTRSSVIADTCSLQLGCNVHRTREWMAHFAIQAGIQISAMLMPRLTRCIPMRALLGGLTL